jgi:hypothetical protein
MISSRLHSRYHRKNIPRYPLDGRLDRSLKRFGCGESPSRTQSAVIQPVVNHCTDWAIHVRKFWRIYKNFKSQDISVGIATDYGLGGRDFSLLHSAHTGSGAHQAAYSMGAGGKADGAWSWPLHLVPKSRMVELYLPSTIPLHGVDIN